jgi:hypothetical protein
MNYDVKILELAKSDLTDNKLLAVSLLQSQHNFTEKQAKAIVYSSLIKMMGETFIKVEQSTDMWEGNDCLKFYLDESRGYMLYHPQDCCEHVWISDINGDLNDLVGSPIMLADESVNWEESECGDSTTWTFYRFATRKGYVDVRFCGQSNGYYSESVYFCEFSDD